MSKVNVTISKIVEINIIKNDTLKEFSKKNWILDYMCNEINYT